MGFPPPSSEQLEKSRRRDTESDAQLEALRLQISSVKKQYEKRFLFASLLPATVENWLQKLFLSHADARYINEAQLELDWVLYDKTCRRRPLYPRKRQLSPSRKDCVYRKRVTKQSALPFFFHTSAEIRKKIYLEVFGGLTIEIQAFVGGSRGPKGSEDRSVFHGSRIEDSTGRYWQSSGYGGFHHKREEGLKPHIIPLLQTCRRMRVTWFH